MNNIQLYIEDNLIELDKSVDFALTKQYKDLSSPTDIINDWSKTVSIPFTQHNNKVFDGLFRTDKLATYGVISPYEKMSFRLILNGAIVMEGYCKINSIDNSANKKSYNVSLYGKLGEIFSELKKITSIKPNTPDKQKYYFGDMFETKMNRQLIKKSWEEPSYFHPELEDCTFGDVIGWSPNISKSKDFDYGLYQTSELNPETEQQEVISKTFKDTIEDAWKTTGSENIVDPDTYVGEGVNPLAFGEFRSYNQIPFIHTKYLFDILGKKCKELTDYSLYLHPAWFNDSNPYYYKTAMCLNQIDTTERSTKKVDVNNNTYTDKCYGYLRANGDASIEKQAFRASGQGNFFSQNWFFNFTNSYTGIDGVTYRKEGNCVDVVSDSIIIEKGTVVNGGFNIDLQVYTPEINLVDDSYDLEINPDATHYLTLQPSAGSANSGIGITVDIIDNNNPTAEPIISKKYLWWFQQDELKLNPPEGWRPINTQEKVCDVLTTYTIKPWVSSTYTLTGFDSTKESGQAGKKDFYAYGRINEQTGKKQAVFGFEHNFKFTPEDLRYIFSKTDSIYIRINGNTIGVNALGEPVNTDGYLRYETLISNQPPYIHYGATVDILKPADKNLYLDTSPYSHVWLNNNINNRSNGVINLESIWSSDEKNSLYNVCMNYTKQFNLMWKVDEDNKKITILPKTAYFSDYTIENWDNKVDYSKDFTITPLLYDNKYFIFNYEDNKSAINKFYKEEYGYNFGEKKLITNYAFNDSEKKLNNGMQTSIIYSPNKIDMAEVLSVTPQFPIISKQSTDIFIANHSDKGETESSFGQLYFYNGIHYFDNVFRSTKNLTDDPIFQQSTGTYFYLIKNRDKVGDVYDSVLSYAELDILNNSSKTDEDKSFNPILLFNIPSKAFDYTANYSNTQSIYDNFFKNEYENEYLTYQSHKLTCYVKLTNIDWSNFEHNKFVIINHILYLVNKIENYSFNSETVKVELIKINDIKNYTENYYTLNGPSGWVELNNGNPIPKVDNEQELLIPVKGLFESIDVTCTNHRALVEYIEDQNDIRFIFDSQGQLITEDINVPITVTYTYNDYVMSKEYIITVNKM